MQPEIVEILKVLLPAIAGGAAVRFLDWMISRTEGGKVITLSDREELKKFIDEMRSKQAEMEASIQELISENSDLKIKLAIIQQERAEWKRRREDWSSRELELLDRIKGLENKVKCLEIERDNRRSMTEG